MPRLPIDYSKTIIYRIVCKDPTIKDCYVGSTTDFKSRKSGHKTTCNTISNKDHNVKVYQFIRDNGGWNNWDMVEIEKYNAIDKLDQRKKERYWIETLDSTLNLVLPSRTHTEYYETFKEEYRENGKIYYENHKDEVIEYKKKYYQEHKEDLSEYYKIYYEEHKNKIKQNSQTYRKEHKDEILKYHKMYYKENKDKLVEYKKNYHQEHRDELNRGRKERHHRKKEQKLMSLEDKY